ncbi:MAG: L,D-transpeptidase [Ignavibacteria bacterium]|nr:L,D-transpeptidase [Ignavibacteria bacterium]
MEESSQNTEQHQLAEDIDVQVVNDEANEHSGKGNAASYLLPLLLCVFLFMGFALEPVKSKKVSRQDLHEEVSENSDKTPKVNFSALLAAEEFSKNLRDTIYTADNLWLEFRIDQQRVYVHYRDGRTISYPVSSGIPGAHKSVDSRPGLFAIFHMNEAHKSSQFQSQLNYFMAFNMGVGFHGLPGTGYYVHLGVRPSSHGCIRMRNDDVKELFRQCKIGTLVLSHKGHTNRTVAFAPEGFKNDAEYTKEDYINMLAYNLGSIMEGKYFITPPKRFIIDGTIIPKSGVNVLSTTNIPEKQMLPFAVARFETGSDMLDDSKFNSTSQVLEPGLVTENFGVTENDSISTGTVQLAVGPEMIKKYVHNPLGILPYFPPNR